MLSKKIQQFPGIFLFYVMHKNLWCAEFSFDGIKLLEELSTYDSR